VKAGAAIGSATISLRRQRELAARAEPQVPPSRSPLLIGEKIRRAALLQELGPASHGQ